MTIRRSIEEREHYPFYALVSPGEEDAETSAWSSEWWAYFTPAELADIDHAMREFDRVQIILREKHYAAATAWRAAQEKPA